MSKFLIGVLLLLQVLTVSVCGQPGYDEEDIFSPDISILFTSIADQIYQANSSDPQVVDQAMVFLEAASMLNKRSDDVYEKILSIAGSTCISKQDYSALIRKAMDSYLTSGGDLEVVSGAMRCLIDTINSRKDRQQVLETFLNDYARTNKWFASQIATQLGTLAMETADYDTALNNFNLAYELNPYNFQAFDKMNQVAQKQGLQLTYHSYLRQKRLAVTANPEDIDAALTFADMARRLELYDIAAQGYQYTADLYASLTSGQKLPEEIYRPWALCCYRALRMQTQCLAIAQRVRRQGDFDLVIEALAGLSMQQIGQVQQGRQALEDAAQKGTSLLQSDPNSGVVTWPLLGWFYAFAMNDSQAALTYSDKALSETPDSSFAKSLYAYTQIAYQSGIDPEGEVFKQAVRFATELKASEQMAALAIALMDMNKQQKESALTGLKGVVAMNPDTLVAEKARQLLKQNESEYISPFSTDQIVPLLEGEFGQTILPSFKPVSSLIDIKLNMSGDVFPYGNDLEGQLVIKNKSSQPLIISESAMVRGIIQIDAKVRGDLVVDIPELIIRRIQPSAPILAGQHYSVPIKLNVARLRKLLNNHPQADLNIEFTILLDPVVDSAGVVGSRINGLGPLVQTITRRKILVNRDALIQKLESLSAGQQGQKIRAAKYFAGLIAEKRIIEAEGAKYRYIKVENDLLVDSLRKTLSDPDWKVQTHTMAVMMELRLPLDYLQVAAVNQSMRHDKWPVCMVALATLSKAQPGTFDQVLDWTAQYDSYWMRRLALALGASTSQN